MLSLTNCELNLPLSSKSSERSYINKNIFCLDIIHPPAFIFLKLFNKERERTMNNIQKVNN
jgi:hypothetical protein